MLHVFSTEAKCYKFSVLKQNDYRFFSTGMKISTKAKKLHIFSTDAKCYTFSVLKQKHYRFFSTGMKISTVPATKPGKLRGKTIRLKMVQVEAPKLRAASIRLSSMACSDK